MSDSPGSPGVPGPVDASPPGPHLPPVPATGSGEDAEPHRRRGRRRHRDPGAGSESRLDRTRRRALVAIAVIGALIVAIAIPVFLSAQPPSAPVRSSSLPTPTLPGSNATSPTSPRPSVVPDASGTDPAPSGAAAVGSSVPSRPAGGTVATRIRIERLGIDLPIIEGDGIDAPIGKAAHYPGTGWPGGGTNVYIYGHAREGMLLPLWGAAVGDTVVLELAGGGAATYRVVEVLPRVPWDADQYLAATPTEILTIQTSTSYYATAPRFIVVAEPVP